MLNENLHSNKNRLADQISPYLLQRAHNHIILNCKFKIKKGDL